MDSLPKVMLVGGPDVDARLELMHYLQNDFNLSVLGSEPDLHDKFSAKNFNYNTYNLSRSANPLADLQTVSELVRIFRQARPQIVHTFDTKPGVWACLAARLAGVPVVIGTVTGLGSLYVNESLKTRSIRMVYQSLQTLACRYSDITVFQNHDDAREFNKKGVVPKDRIKVILGSGVSTELFSRDRVSEKERTQLRNKLGFQPDNVVVTMISRLIRSKGVLEFMSAARELGVRFPNIRFLLIGPEDNESLDRLNSAELTQLKEAVTWPGPRRDIPALLAASDVFVFPSAYREGIPRVLLEAASMELPLVTTNSPGCNEVVENGVNGFLVPVRAPAALSQAITHLIEQPELRQCFGRNSRQRIVDRFDLSVIADQTISLYRNLLARKSLLPNEESY
jgi:glycosyltransferase involved in cell wall biosynthesis